MIDRLKHYTEYKESGLPWLGKIPDHWKTGPGFAAFREKQVKNTGIAEKQVLSLSYGKIVIKPPEKLHGLVPDSFETYQIVDSGDIIIRSTDLQNDWNSLRVGLVHDRGIITSAYLCFRTTGTLLSEYGYQLLHTFDLMKVFYGMGSGLRQNLSFLDFKRMIILVPPPDEQAAIVRFLDHANRRIDRFIKAKKKVIALLNEQKQAIIHRAVTRGIDPNVPLKPSSIPWLGEIPEHWEIRPLKHWAKLNSRSLSEKTSPKYKFNYIDIGSVGTGRLTREPERFRFKQAPSRARRIVSFGDTIISTVRTYLKAVYFINEHRDNLIASTGFAVLSPGPHVVPECLSFLIQSSVFIDQVTANSIGIAYPAIAESRIGTFHLAIPPDKTEQKEILEHIQREMNPFDSALAQAQREIDLVREYRTRLIADVVTGKLDVREAAKKLTEEAAESNIIDEDETPVEDEEMTNCMNGEGGE